MDGVLRSSNKIPIYEGVSLYKSLNVNGSVFLACDDQEEAQRWCKEHKLDDIDGFISNKTVGDYEDKDFLKVQHQQASGPLFMVILADVDLATKCVAQGIKTLLFCIILLVMIFLGESVVMMAQGNSEEEKIKNMNLNENLLICSKHNKKILMKS